MALVFLRVFLVAYRVFFLVFFAAYNATRGGTYHAADNGTFTATYYGAGCGTRATTNGGTFSFFAPAFFGLSLCFGRSYRAAQHKHGRQHGYIYFEGFHDV